MTPEEQFLAQLELIERVIESICRRHRCYGAEAEDFGSSVKLRLIDNDYAVLRKFQGKSLLATYLTTVISNLFRDHRIRQWGKWRPSAAARRLGTVAIFLDELLHRDGYTFDEAVTKLRTDFRVKLSSHELREIAIRLPPRTPRRELEGDEQLLEVASDDAVEDRVVDLDRAEMLRKTEAALADALESLAPEDRLIIKLRFDGFKVAKIAESLGLAQRPLYSRIERILKNLRLFLEAAGLQREAVRQLYDWKGFDLRVDYNLEEPEVEEARRGKENEIPQPEDDAAAGRHDEEGPSRENARTGPSNTGGGL